MTARASRVAVLSAEILHHLKHTLARDPHTATTRDWWLSTAMAVRDHVLEDFIHTMGVHNGLNVRRVYFFSLEYLMGRRLWRQCRSRPAARDAASARSGRDR